MGHQFHRMIEHHHRIHVTHDMSPDLIINIHINPAGFFGHGDILLTGIFHVIDDKPTIDQFLDLRG